MNRLLLCAALLSSSLAVGCTTQDEDVANAEANLSKGWVARAANSASFSAKLAEVPGLRDDVRAALKTPAATPLDTTFADFARFADVFTYDEDHLNGPPTNTSAESATPSVPVGEDKASILQRYTAFLRATWGVTVCNKAESRIELRGVPSLPVRYSECQLVKIDNLGKFYVDALAGRAELFFRKREIASISTTVLENGSGLGGFWTEGPTIQPTPAWLDRVLFFKDADAKNAVTGRFVRGLFGTEIGTSTNAERIIDDPIPTAKDAAADGKVRGLRSWGAGQGLRATQADAPFATETLGFGEAIRPVAEAFAKHGREDLFIDFLERVAEAAKKR